MGASCETAHADGPLVTVFFLALLLYTPPDPGLPNEVVPTPAGLLAAPWDPLVVGECKEKLLAAGLTGKEFRFSKTNVVLPRKVYGHDPIYCHVPQPTVAWTGPTGMRWIGYTYTNCAMALALTRFERIAQDEARRVFGRPDGENPVVWAGHLGTFNCRWMRQKAKQSQHSFGNAIDVSSFFVKGFGEVQVKRHWRALYPAWEKPSQFLHALVTRLRDEEVFTNVLDPDWDPAHWNHLHLDLAPLSNGLPSGALDRTMKMPGTSGH
jgi:hypothetical protein